MPVRTRRRNRRRRVKSARRRYTLFRKRAQGGAAENILRDTWEKTFKELEHFKERKKISAQVLDKNNKLAHELWDTDYDTVLNYLIDLKKTKTKLNKIDIFINEW
jgi:hypothetical protein